jgi:hypothetical protein
MKSNKAQYNGDLKIHETIDDFSQSVGACQCLPAASTCCPAPSTHWQFRFSLFDDYLIKEL